MNLEWLQAQDTRLTPVERGPSGVRRYEPGEWDYQPGEWDYQPGGMRNIRATPTTTPTKITRSRTTNPLASAVVGCSRCTAPR